MAMRFPIFWVYLAIVSCGWPATGCVSTPKNFATQPWLGHSQQELFAAWGAPAEERSDGYGGKILTYERVSGYITPGSVTADTSDRFIVDEMQPRRTTHHQVFYVNRNGKIYRWSRQ
jgi:hypothetical protein